MRPLFLLGLVVLSMSGCYRAHTNGEGGVPDTGARDSGPLPDGTGLDARDTGIAVGECRTDDECPPPIASCARAFCFDLSCGVVEIPGACPFDSFCDLARGCVPSSTGDGGHDAAMIFPDVGLPDAAPFDAGFLDAPIDAFTPDAFVEDAGPPPVSAGIRCTPSTVLRVPAHTQLDVGPVGTLELWVRARGPGTIAIKGTPAGARYFHLRIEGTGDEATLIGGWGSLAGEQAVSVPFGDRMGRWTHVALVQRDLGDTVSLSLVLDGVLASTATVVDDFVRAANSLDFRLCMLDADLDEVRVWRVVREDSSIVADLRRTLPSGIVGLAAYWPLEGGGQIVLDRSLHGVEGVLGETSDVERVDPMRIPGGAF